jgi:eukaryotic-like serine/threonine-protein kinase
MTPERWVRIKEVFTNAAERVGEARAAYVEEACGADEELRREVESLLRERPDGSTFESPIRKPDLSGRSISHYRVLEKLGEGGMGEVWKAEDTQLRRTVALKFLSSETIGNDEVKVRLIREAQASASLDHPNICAVHGIHEENGRTFIAMAFIDGPSLAEKIKKRPLPLAEALDIAIQIAAGMQEAHEKGVVHRDIKPHNIMLTAKGQVKVMDFGLASLVGRSKLTKSGTRLGTPAYMAPEQLQGRQVDQRADIWALGCVLYEMLAQHSPFEAESEQAIGYGILNGDPEPVSAQRADVKPEVDQLIAKTLAKNPDERYQYTDDLLVDLRNLRAKSPDTQSSLSAPRGVGPATEQKWFWPAVAACLALVAGGLAAVHFSEPAAPPLPQIRRFSFTPDSLMDSRSGLSSQASGLSHAVVSPNGRWIVYVSGEDPPALWLRPINSERPRKLEGTEGALPGPFWSSDSSFIGFAAEGALKQVGVEGTRPTIVCNVPKPEAWTGGTWDPSGETIIFGSAVGYLVLFEVRAGGGKAAPLADSFGGRSPEFLPSEQGDRAILFSRTDGIYFRNLGSGETSKLMDGDFPRYSPSGHIVFRTERVGELWAVPFSADDGVLTGEPFKIAEGVASANLSADGMLLTVDLVGNRQKRLVWKNRLGEKLSEIGRPEVQLMKPELSPDGRFVATGTTSGEGVIWLHEANRAVGNPLTVDVSGGWGIAVWSPKGDQLAFNTDDSVYLKAVNGRGEAQAISSECGIPHSWAPDGQSLLCTKIMRTAQGSNYDIWLLDLSSDSHRSEPALSTRFNEGFPQFSPDGRHLAYASDQSGAYEIYVADFPSFANKVQISQRGGTKPRWSHDASELFYAEEQRILMAVEMIADPSLRPGKVESLFPYQNQSIHVWDYDVSVDGRFVIVEDAAPEDAEQRKPAIRITENWYEEFRDSQRD